jgi:imidazoleglycerol-phosphate dehydratase
VRTAEIKRKTEETDIALSLNVDGTGAADIATGIGFLDHMLTLLAHHSLCDLTIRAEGDRHVDAHHTVEDIGICLGDALRQAAGDKKGVRRFGHALVPMDEALASTALDFSGRPCLVFNVDFQVDKVGDFDVALAAEFLQALANHAGMNLHVNCSYGRNAHHMVEAIFKALAHSLRAALESDPRRSGVPSTKGTL